MLQDVLTSLQSVINGAIAAQGIQAPNQVILGWPLASDLAEIIVNGGWQVSIYPVSSRRTTRYIGQSDRGVVTAPNVPIESVIGGNGTTLTFSGTAPVAGINVHVILAQGATAIADAFYQTTASDTMTTLYQNIASAVNALGISGVSATATGSSVTVSGATIAHANVGGTGTYAMGVGRISRTIQVSIWAPNPTFRSIVVDAILAAIGNGENAFLTLPNNAGAWIQWSGTARGPSDFDDDAQLSYSLYVDHIYFDVDYVVEQQLPATQIGSVEVTKIAGGSSPVVEIIGG